MIVAACCVEVRGYFLRASDGAALPMLDALIVYPLDNS
jgi:hypothetical protein